MSILHQFSFEELLQLIDLKDTDAVMVNTLVSKFKISDEGYDIYSNKLNLISLVENIISNRHFSKKSIRKKILSKLSSSDISKLIETVSEKNKSMSRKDAEKILLQQPWVASSFAEKFLQVCGVYYDHFFITDKKPYADCIDIQAPDVTFKPLKHYQSNIFERSTEMLSTPRKRLMICMPTGTGKTRTAMEIICHTLQKKKSSRVIWLVDSYELMYQAVECFVQTWEHIGSRNASVKLLGFGHKAELQPDITEFVVSGLQVLINMSDHVFAKIANGLELIVFDEAHKLIAPKYKRVVNKLTPVTNKTRVLGLSATPVRSRESESRGLVEAFHNNIVVLPSLSRKHSVFESLVRRDVLARPRWLPLKYDPTVVLTKDDFNKLRSGREPTQQILHKIATDVNRNLALLKVLVELGQKNKITLFFGATVDQSRQIATALNCLKIKGVHIDSNTSREERLGHIARFRRKEISTICNYGVLTTGFDAPAVDAIVIGRPTTSKILISQMIGRGLRGKQLGGTELCEIYIPNDKVIDFIGQVEIEKFQDAWDDNDQYY